VVARQKPQPGAATHLAHSVMPRQGSSLDVHRPPEQVRPEQQSAVTEQVCEAVRQTHRPPSQAIRPQQSDAVLHDPELPLQQTVRPELSRQLSRSQHSVAAVHASPAGVQATGARQTLSRHSRPEAQAGSRGQQASPEPPHSGSQAPREQVPSHRVPQVPQFRASDCVSTQVPVQQDRPRPVQVSPAQHAWPTAPQAVSSVWHWSSRQTRPALHAEPSQQASLGPPQGGTGWQTSRSQTRPEAQSPGSQQGCRSAPHAAGREQTSRSHTSPAPQTPPVQQGPPDAPHSSRRSHRMS
jgi:hypothetical protein